MSDVFTGSFTQQEPIPDDGIEAAMRVLKHGRLHRYNVSEGELGETALLEQEFAAYTGSKYALAVASGGYAIGCALRAVGVKAGDKVLTNGFTLAPVPGAIASLGAVPIFVEVTDSLTIDLDDLRDKAIASEARVLLLSHMRGHLCDMDRLVDICAQMKIKVIEDCAHTMGATWKGKASGTHGVFGCYSTQTYKHINSGEGGLLVSNEDKWMARAIMLSGSYMLYERHKASPPADVFEKVKWDTPNVSGRMDNLRAAILRPQLVRLDEQVDAWNDRYFAMEEGMGNTPGLALIKRAQAGRFVGSSFQFLLPGRSAEELDDFVTRCATRGVELKWFGGAAPKGFTSRYDSWRYAPAQSLPRTDRILSGLMDMRLPLTFSVKDCSTVASILRDEVLAFDTNEPAA